MNQWDGKWYEKVVTQGYDYHPDGREYDINFFPLYPALVWLLMRIGLGFAAAGTLTSNLALLGALFLLYRHTAESYGNPAAGWAVAAMTWFPLSVLCSVTYTESLFLLVTLAFLEAFESERYWLAALLAAMVALCRLPGMSIVPAILILALVKKLSWRAYMPAAAACFALGGFIAFQALRFHDPLAFVHTQENWAHSTVVDVFRTFYRPNNLMRILALPTAAVLLWSYRRDLHKLDLLYAGFSLALILCSMRAGSANRYVFAIAPLFLATGIWLSKRPRFATTAVVVSGVALSFESLAWAWDHFLG